MKQIIQDLKNGQTSMVELPAPMLKDGHVLIQTRCSLVSKGTEKMLVDFGKASLLSKALQQPDRVKQVIQKAKTDGLLPTIQAVKRKLDEQIPLGYCQVGEVMEVAANVSQFKKGDRVASNGPHAEFVLASKNLIARIPDTVTYKQAAFTVPASIALQGIRLLNPQFGEVVVVYGLGLIGLLATKLLIANGCKVIGLDIDEEKLQQAKNAGATTFNSQENPVGFIHDHSDGKGADAVLLTVSSDDDKIIQYAAHASRKRGRIVLVGVTGLHLHRADFYEKELTFQVSSSYGPGRYEAAYEHDGLDYPIGFVRWTAQRNFDAVLAAMASGQLVVDDISTREIPFESFREVYGDMANLPDQAQIFVYPDNPIFENRSAYNLINNQAGDATPITAAVIGTGSYSSSVLLPNLIKQKVAVLWIVGKEHLKAGLLAQKFQVPEATTDYEHALQDANINTVFISNRHAAHADIAVKALGANKHVFVEKPLAINTQQLNDVQQALQHAKTSLMVGYNRRFAPLANKMKSLISDTLPLSMSIQVNAGKLPTKHWLQQEAQGGRIVGELCHFIDLASFLIGEEVDRVCAQAIAPSIDKMVEDAQVLIAYKNGSQASITYCSEGSMAYEKERIELHQNGKTLVLENWKKLIGYGFKNFNRCSASQDKGHSAMYQTYYNQRSNGDQLSIPIQSLLNTSSATIAVLQSIQHGNWVDVP